MCPSGQVFDKTLEKCLKRQESNLDRDALYEAVRQLACAGRYHDAQDTLEVMDDNDPGRLTYMGFTHRKLGNKALAARYYDRAIQADPVNILARSYMGQGFVDEGRIADAKALLDEIRAYGGTGSWSEISLRNAILTGSTYSY